MKHPTFKSDLVIGLACFDYGVLFKWQKTVAVDCYQHLFKSFSSRGWVARELRNAHIDDYIQFVDNVRHVYLDELGVGPDVEDMVSFLSSCPELSRRRYTWDLFKLSCLCLGHVAPKLPDVALGSSKVGVTSVDLSSILEQLQGYWLSSDADGIFSLIPDQFRLAWNCSRPLVIVRFSVDTILGNLSIFMGTRKFELSWRNRIRP